MESSKALAERLKFEISEKENQISIIEGLSLNASIVASLKVPLVNELYSLKQQYLQNFGNAYP